MLSAEDALGVLAGRVDIGRPTPALEAVDHLERRSSVHWAKVSPRWRSSTPQPFTGRAPAGGRRLSQGVLARRADDVDHGLAWPEPGERSSSRPDVPLQAEAGAAFTTIADWPSARAPSSASRTKGTGSPQLGQPARGVRLATRTRAPRPAQRRRPWPGRLRPRRSPGRRGRPDRARPVRRGPQEARGIGALSARKPALAVGHAGVAGADRLHRVEADEQNPTHGRLRGTVTFSLPHPARRQPRTASPTWPDVDREGGQTSSAPAPRRRVVHLAGDSE